MAFLRRHFRVLSAAEFESCLQNGSSFESGSCLVTFDDGWLDTYTHAFPILRRHGIPALVFLPSAYIGTGKMFWQEHLGAILFRLWNKARGNPEVAVAARRQLADFDLAAVLDSPEDEVREQIMALVRRRKSAELADPFAPVRVFSESPMAEHSPAAVDRFMDWDQVHAMHRDGISFGAHGDTHRQLTALTREEIQRELGTSKEVLETRLGDRATTVSYPNGDWNATVLQEARRSAFVVGFTTEPGRVASGDERFTIRRINIHEHTTSSLPMFLAKLVGVV
jgi:peptidoglycan/xylan/chitin deacetylase (PgdA/CDA1 family)